LPSGGDMEAELVSGAKGSDEGKKPRSSNF